MNTVETGGMTITSSVPVNVSLEKNDASPAELYKFTFAWNPSETDASSTLTISCEFTEGGCEYLWHPGCRTNRALLGDWQCSVPVMTTFSAPVFCAFDEGGTALITFAVSELKKKSTIKFGLNEKTALLTASVSFPMNLLPKGGRYSVTLYINRTPSPFEQALGSVRRWWESFVSPMPAPRSTFAPLFSSWYCFHQDLYEENVEKECAAAAEMGMKTVIIDDGWQTADGEGGYRFCGDWEVYGGKIKDMRAHVSRVQAIGLKYMLWYSVPFVGYDSKNFDKFSDMLLCRDDRLKAGVLDPRYPEVRRFLTDTYKNALINYGLDGFKLDFIDRFVQQPESPSFAEGMDYACVQEATDRLMTDIMLELKSIKPDILIEFRQNYIGPNMRHYGNMFRVADCPGSAVTNRVGIIDLRLLCGESAVHSDMIMWNKNASVTTAAKQLLACLFGVIQFSVKPSELSPEHKKMARFWLDFAAAHENTLLHSPLKAYSPQLLYPVISACSPDEAVIGVYSENSVITLPEQSAVYIANSTGQKRIAVLSEKETSYKITVKSCTGETEVCGNITLPRGLSFIYASPCGLTEIQKQ